MAERLLLLFALLILRIPEAGAMNSNISGQSNVNFGMDQPSNGATHSEAYYLLRIQLEKASKLFAPRASFTLDSGTDLLGGEVNLGLAIYPFYRYRDSLRAQPFIGAEADLFMGSRDNSAILAPGGAPFGGVDFRLFGNFGVTFEADYVVLPGQHSARLWLGFHYYSPPSN